MGPVFFRLTPTKRDACATASVRLRVTSGTGALHQCELYGPMHPWCFLLGLPEGVRPAVQFAAVSRQAALLSVRSRTKREKSTLRRRSFRPIRSEDWERKPRQTPGSLIRGTAGQGSSWDIQPRYRGEPLPRTPLVNGRLACPSRHGQCPRCRHRPGHAYPDPGEHQRRMRDPVCEAANLDRSEAYRCRACSPAKPAGHRRRQGSSKGLGGGSCGTVWTSSHVLSSIVVQHLRQQSANRRRHRQPIRERPGG